MTKHYVYLLCCADGTLYCGYTTDLDERVRTHNGETSKVGAKYTRGRRPVTLVYHEQCVSRAAALKREVAIKQLTRQQKEQLIQSAA